MPFKLSCVLYGHSLDVRALAVTEAGWLISTSRDKTSKVWKPNGYNSGFTEAATLQGHNSFVSCVCVLPSSTNFPDGLILTGGFDKNIRAYHPTQFNPLFILEDHSDNVCSLTCGVKTEHVLSSSWDKSVKMWSLREQRCIMTLTGHELSVWSVLQMSSGAIATGSADRTVRVYSSGGNYLRTLTGHKDCVRGLAALSAVELLSCGNDATIRRWNIETGESLHIYYGHNHYIYSVVASDGIIVSGGEDRAVRVWTGQDSELILLPVQSVWAVARLPNGDIAAGSSDGMVRVFSSEPSRQADETTLLSYDEEIANFGKSDEQEIGGVKISDLPGREALYEPGRNDGQTKMIREGAGVTCYSWSAAECQWNKIGDVMGAQASQGKTLHNGKEYDYVFSVDIDDSMPPLKLPYNRGDDPWVAAQLFIHTHNLSQQFLETVANFIITNSKDNTPAPSSSAQGDPFTGGTRYVPGGGGTNSVGGVDPFTGGSRYVPGSNNTSSTQSSRQSVPPSTTLFPQTTYIRFDQGNLDAIFDKLQEFNPGQSASVSTSALEEVVKLGILGATLDTDAVNTLETLLNWPPEVLFPVLDITRLAVRNATINDYLCKSQEDNQLFTILEQHLLPTALPTNQMLALRVTSNMMSHSQGEALVLSKRHFLLAMIRQLASAKASKALQIALMTVVLNLSVGVLNVKDMPCAAEIVASLSLLLPWLPEPEAVLRGLVALGTLLNYSITLKDEVTSNCLDRLKSLAAETTSPKTASCATQLLHLLKL